MIPMPRSKSNPRLPPPAAFCPSSRRLICPSAANNNYWPEIYTNQSMIEPSKTEYSDTPSPKVFGNTSPLDPQLFSRINDFAGEMLSRRAQRQIFAHRSRAMAGGSRRSRSKPCKGSPHGHRHRHPIRPRANSLPRNSARRSSIRFMSATATRGAGRSAQVLSRCPRRLGRAGRTGQGRLRSEHHRRGASLAPRPLARPPSRHRRRYRAIGKRLATAKHRQRPESQGRHRRSHRPAATVLPSRCAIALQTAFRRNQPLALELSGPAGPASARALLSPRQPSRALAVRCDGPQRTAYAAAIPAAYTDSPYPLQYYFELKSAPDRAWLYPGFPADLAGQPYYVVRS